MRKSDQHKNGFSIIEVIVTLLILSLTVTMILKITKSSLMLCNGIMHDQNINCERRMFINLMNSYLVNLDGSSTIIIDNKIDNNKLINYIIIESNYLNQTWLGGERHVRSIKLVSTPRLNGNYDIIAHFYDLLLTSNPGYPAFSQMVLLKDVKKIEWSAIDSETGKSNEKWVKVQNLPSRIELSLSHDDFDDLQYSFWIAGGFHWPMQPVRW
jgi:prepilin-type N-terminal cleavage/methylation domain-containing protein